MQRSFYWLNHQAPTPVVYSAALIVAIVGTLLFVVVLHAIVVEIGYWLDKL